MNNNKTNLELVHPDNCHEETKIDSNLLEMFLITLKQTQFKLGEHDDFSKLSISQLHYIEAISQSDSPTITEIANSLEITKASVTVGVKRLIDMGFIIKRKSDQDKRISYILLTEKGKKLLMAKQHALEEYEKNLVSALSTIELRQLEGIMEKIIRHFNVLTN